MIKAQAASGLLRIGPFDRFRLAASHGEPLVAYRWDGETDLVPGHFVAAK
jgi:hypothetical protein